MNNFLISFAFVLLYGSGFIAAKIGVAYADPLVFLALRFVLAGAVLAIICLLMRKIKPVDIKVICHQMVAGTFLIGLFSVGVFVSIDQGTSPAISSLIISFQPLLVALVCYFLWQEPISRKTWYGLLLGLLGVTAILFNELGETPLFGLLMSFIGLVGLTVGSLYQKRFCTKVSIFTAGMINSLTASLLCFILLFCFPVTMPQWNIKFLGALFWMSFIVSVCALSLFYILVKRRSISQISSLFYLMPVSTLLLSALFFDKHINGFSAAGVMVTALGMFFINNTNPKETTQVLESISIGK